MQKLTERQRKFVLFYDGNATQAAIKAGYSKHTAHAIGQENLRKPTIKNALRERQDKKEAPIIASRQERQKFWTDVMKGKKVAMMNKLRASELLGKSEGDFIENTHHSGEITMAMPTIKIGGKPVEFDVGST